MTESDMPNAACGSYRKPSNAEALLEEYRREIRRSEASRKGLEAVRLSVMKLLLDDPKYSHNVTSLISDIERISNFIVSGSDG